MVYSSCTSGGYNRDVHHVTYSFKHLKVIDEIPAGA
jgi:hypothetical protein